MTPDKRQPNEQDPKTGLSPWVIAGALTAGAATWFLIELIKRVM